MNSFYSTINSHALQGQNRRNNHKVLPQFGIHTYNDFKPGMTLVCKQVELKIHAITTEPEYNYERVLGRWQPTSIDRFRKIVHYTSTRISTGKTQECKTQLSNLYNRSIQYVK